jgi:hypothetical protein
VIKIGQMVHGYDRGHRLLATSVALGSESEHIALNLSDLSGARPERGFDGYLTAYPLRRERAYVFARSWYATELPRPGCVWTHSLVMTFAEIAEIVSLRMLLPLFRRPQGEDDAASRQYEEEITLQQNWPRDERSYSSPRSATTDVGALLLQHLYTGRRSPVFLLAHDTTQFESLVLEIWDQQWPELRVQSTLCTGSLGLRMLNNRVFDLNVIPRSASRIAQQASSRAVVDPDSVDDIKSTSWSSYAAGALFEGDDRLRMVLWRYGPDTEHPWRTYANLARLFFAIELAGKDSSPESVSQFVLSAFPIRTDARKLKSDLFGLGIVEGTPFNWPVAERLAYFATHSIEGFVDVEDLRLRDSAARLAVSDPAFANRLFSTILDNAARGQAAVEVLGGLTDGVDDETLINSIRRNPEALKDVVLCRPEMLYQVAFWRSVPWRALSDAESILRQLNDVDVFRLSSALLESGTAIPPDDIVKRSSRQASEALIKYVEREEAGGSAATSLWFESCAKFPNDLMIASISPRVSADGTIQTVLNAVQAKVLGPADSGLADIAKAIRASSGRHFGDLRIQILLIALSYPYPWAIDAVAATFEDAHDALSRTTPASSPMAISFFLPWLLLSAVEDRAENLRKALVLRFVSAQWPFSSFREIVQKGSTLRKVFKTAKGMGADGRRFLKNLELEFNELDNEGDAEGSGPSESDPTS